MSTGVKDANGVEAVLGNPARVSALNVNGNAYGYAIKGVEFTYVRVASIRTFSESEDGAEHIEVLYGIAPTEQNNTFLSAIGVSTNDRYSPADEVVDGMTVYYYRSDVLIDGLKAALDANATSVKNALEKYARDNHGVAMTETDAYGHTGASDLPLGLYLLIETRVPEMVTDTTAPFLVSLPMTAVDGNNANDGGTRWIYDVTLYPKNLTGIPSLEKTLREDKSDTGKNDGSTSDITDGYAHTGTASAGDVIDSLSLSRRELYRRKRRGEDVGAEIKEISLALRPIRRELRCTQQIVERIPQLQAQIRLTRQTEEQSRSEKTKTQQRRHDLWK